MHDFIHQNSNIISIEQVPAQSLFSAKETYSGFRLHLADLAVVAILCKKENTIVVTDDMELRKTVESAGRAVIGTVGVLFRAYKQGTIGENKLRNLVDLLFNDSSLYLSSALIATKTRNLFGLSFRFQIQTIMKKHFENVFDSWCTPAYSDIRPTIEFAHFPFQRGCC